ncbi:hypothetical protein [Kurthia sp. Dielmo]|uniref:hypothetical protein n=1 Tax=Kurthia sp. Dielmo TaxID=1033738 RepID=UPI00111FDEEF|nr:hypothetical protein [Kurthia sp. Dielmo]
MKTFKQVKNTFSGNEMFLVENENNQTVLTKDVNNLAAALPFKEKDAQVWKEVSGEIVVRSENEITTRITPVEDGFFIESFNSIVGMTGHVYLPSQTYALIIHNKQEQPAS